MSTINLDQKGISNAGPEFNAIGPNLQSNILKSHARDHAKLLFLKFNAGAGKIKTWIKNFVSQEQYVLSAAGQKADTEAFKQGIKSKIVANFYLTAKGYEQLGFDTDKFIEGNMETEDDDSDEEVEDTSGAIFGSNDFVRGMKSRRVNNKLKDPEVHHWEQEYATDMHAMVLLADDDEARLNAEIDTVKNSLQGIATIIKEEEGHDINARLPNGKKIHTEHFGYADGISQPRYFTEDIKTSPVDLQPLSIILVKDPFTNKDDTNYGSFLVFRKLEQDVDGFNKRISELAAIVKLNANQQGKITAEDFAGALIVGRFKDGTPLIKSDVKLEESPAFNDFKYEHTDRQAHKCPFQAHIRKTNPRGQGVLVPIKGRFITRRGIPFGKPGSDEKKGLLFMCFQANLKRQFNFIQKTWANAPGFPPFRGKPGIDPLIRQGSEGEQCWPKEYGSEIEFPFDFAGFIKLRGGEYFFAPSLGFLKSL
ncbi:MAG TPA: Dyp-type peroxidase [Chitinophagaceae bacterium]|nr:Dyp-type peroxidase [Chitinophagaceae bacterium]